MSDGDILFLIILGAVCFLGYNWVLFNYIRETVHEAKGEVIRHIDDRCIYSFDRIEIVCNKINVEERADTSAGNPTAHKPTTCGYDIDY